MKAVWVGSGKSLRKGPVPCFPGEAEKDPNSESREALGPISQTEPRGEDPKEKKWLLGMT